MPKSKLQWKFFNIIIGRTNKEFNMRHDWNSLLSEDESLRMTKYSKRLYPKADVLVRKSVILPCFNSIY